MNVENLEQEIETAPKIICGKYLFHKYSFGEEGTYLKSEVINEIKEGLVSLASEFNFDCIVSTEPGSHIWGLLVACYLKKPLNIIRSKNPKLTHESIKIQRTGYCVRGLNFCNFKKGDSVIIIEDVIATGATTDIIIKTLKSKGVKVRGVISILRKNLDKLNKKYKIPIKALVESK